MHTHLYEQSIVVSCRVEERWLAVFLWVFVHIDSCQGKRFGVWFMVRAGIQYNTLCRCKGTILPWCVWMCDRGRVWVCWWAYLPMQHAYAWANRDLNTHRGILSLSHSLSLSLSRSRLLSHTHIQAGLDPFDQCLKTAKQQWDADGKGTYQTRNLSLFSLRLSFLACIAISQPSRGGGSSPEGQVSACWFIGSLVGLQVDADICMCWICFCLNPPLVSSRNLTDPDSLPRTKNKQKKVTWRRTSGG